MSNTQTNDNRGIRLRHVWWFVGLAIVCSIVAWIVMDKANDRLEATHKTIIEHQLKSLEEIETFLKSYQTLINDSTSKTNKRSLEQLNNQLLDIARNATENNGSERIGNLLESELSKIQSEYEVLNLWCALLTVVFLIFSFFSIFKANEMANQSEDSLRDMRGIEKDVREKAGDVDKQVNQAKTKIAEITQSLSSLNSQCDDLSTRVNTIKDVEIAGLNTQIKAFDETIKKLREHVEEQKKDFDKYYAEKLSEFDTSIEEMRDEARSNIEEFAKVSFESQNDSLIKRLDKFESSIDDLSNDVQELKTGNPTPEDLEAAAAEEREADGQDEDEMENPGLDSNSGN